MFIAYSVQKVLLVLQPDDRLLQSRECDISTGLRLISSVSDTLRELRDEGDNTLESLTAEMNDLLDLDEEPLAKRRRKMAINLGDSVVVSSVGQSTEIEPESTVYRQIIFGILDNCMGELNARFGERNKKVL